MPTEKVIRDRVGTRLGTMIDTGNEIVARNRVGTRLGHYDKRTNSTRDKWGNKIAEGNIASNLVVDDWKQR
jgi:hypothetical protein